MRERMEEFGRLLWRPRVGPLIKFDDVDVGWLTNIVAFCERALSRAESEEAACWGVSFQGEMAQMYQEQAQRDIGDRVERMRVFLEELRLYHAWRVAELVP